MLGDDDRSPLPLNGFQNREALRLELRRWNRYYVFRLHRKWSVQMTTFRIARQRAEALPVLLYFRRD